MKKPDKCCEMGSYEHQVPMPIKGRRCEIDLCIADIVCALNAANITTVASCCGHNVVDTVIILEDGRTLIIAERDKVIDDSGRFIYRPKISNDIKKER